MTLSVHSISVPAYVHTLGVVSRYLDLAMAHAASAGIDPATLVDARLAPDMLTLAGQVQRASDTSKNAVARLLGEDAPSFPDNETTLEQLKARVQATIAYVRAADASALDAAAGREIKLSAGALERTFTGENYLLQFGLPNFYFHVAMVHAILRNQGLAIGKLDFLGVNA